MQNTFLLFKKNVPFYQWLLHLSVCVVRNFKDSSETVVLNSALAPCAWERTQQKSKDKFRKRLHSENNGHKVYRHLQVTITHLYNPCSAFYSYSQEHYFILPAFSQAATMSSTQRYSWPKTSIQHISLAHYTFSAIQKQLSFHHHTPKTSLILFCVRTQRN